MNSGWLAEGSFRSQTSDQYGEMEKQRWEESGRRSQEVRRSEKRKSEKQEDAGARQGRKVTIHCVFQMIWGSGGSKSNLPKAAGAELAGQMRDEKLHAVLARSKFRSQNVQSTPMSDHFWKLSCRKSDATVCHSGAKRIFQVKMYKAHQYQTTFGSWAVEKSARHCGAKRVSKSKCTKHPNVRPLLEVELSKKCTPQWREALSKSKCTKHTNVRPLLEVEMSKKCTPLWREAHVQVKMHKTHHVWITFWSWDVEKVRAVVARNTCPSQNVQKHTMFGPLFDIQISQKCALSWREALSKSKV